MNNIFFEKLKDKNLTNVQKKIAEYFIEKEYLICQKSLLDIANEIGTSDASIIRFCRIMGYNGFADLKNELYDKMVEKMNGAPLQSRFNTKLLLQKNEDILNEFIEIAKNNVEKTLKQNSMESYNEVIDLLLNSRIKCIIGFRGCKGLALQFANALRYLLDNVIEIVNDEPNSISALQGLGNQDFIVFFSFVRYYKIDICIAEFAKKNGIKICVITDNIVSPLAKYADIILKVDTSNIGFFNSSIAANSLYEYLLNVLCLKNKDFVQERLTEYDKLTDYFR